MIEVNPFAELGIVMAILLGAARRQAERGIATGGPQMVKHMDRPRGA